LLQAACSSSHCKLQKKKTTQCNPQRAVDALRLGKKSSNKSQTTSLCQVLRIFTANRRVFVLNLTLVCFLGTQAALPPGKQPRSSHTRFRNEPSRLAG
jgi:hypothetical protein